MNRSLMFSIASICSEIWLDTLSEIALHSSDSLRKALALSMKKKKTAAAHHASAKAIVPALGLRALLFSEKPAPLEFFIMLHCYHTMSPPLFAMEQFLIVQAWLAH
jgi:hypothetical protein